MNAEEALEIIRSHAEAHPEPKMLAAQIGCSYNRLMEFRRGAKGHEGFRAEWLLRLCFILEIDLSKLKNDEPITPRIPEKAITGDEEKAARLWRERRWPKIIRWATDEWERQGEGNMMHQNQAMTMDAAPPRSNTTHGSKRMVLNDSAE